MLFNPPPLANVFACYSDDPAVRANVTFALQGAGYRVQQWAALGWLLASKPLPDSTPSAQPVWDDGAVFAEGERTVLTGAKSSPWHALDTPQTLASQWSGDYTLLRLDSSKRSLTAVRSCGGWVPLYVWQGADRFIAASSCTDLVRLGGWLGQPDALSLATWVAGWPVFPDQRSHLAGVRIMAKGEWLRWSPGQHAPNIQQYWNPQPQNPIPIPSESQKRERQQALRSLLLGSLSTHLHPEGGNLMSLSGGVDSASLTALAVGQLGLPLMTWSLVPPKNAASYPRFTADLADIRQRYGIEQFWETEMRLDIQASAAQHDGPVADHLFPTVHPMLKALPGIVASTPIRTLCGGENADEIVGSDWFSQDDWAFALPLWRAIKPGNAPSLKWALRWWLVQRYKQGLLGKPKVPMSTQLPLWFKHEVTEQALDYLARQQRIAARLPSHNRITALRLQAFDFQAMQWEISSRLGIRRVIPFSTREVVQLSLDSHPLERLAKAPKLLLRGALAADVPHHLLWRGKGVGFGVRLGTAPQDATPLHSALQASSGAASWLALPQTTQAKPLDIVSGLKLNDFLRRGAPCWAS